MITKDIKIKLLEGALQVLDGGKNWIKQDYWDTEHSYCLAGAVFESARREGFITEQVTDEEYGDIMYIDSLTGMSSDTLGQIADELTGEVSLTKLVAEKGFNNVPQFNDSYDTTFKDIEKFVRQRISMIEEETDDDDTA